MKTEIQNLPDNGKKRVIIVGGGFAGLRLARRLAGSRFQVVLLDKNNYHQFQPLFYQVATSGLEPSSISFPFRKIFQKKANLHFRMGELLHVNAKENKINTSIGELSYDHLVIATGVNTNFFGNDSIQKHAIPMKSVSEAIFLRNSILRNYEKAMNTNDPLEQQQYMNIAIVGGGATGVELAGALAEMKHHILPKDYPELDFSRMQVYLFEAGSKLLAGMSETASGKSIAYLKKLGVQVQTGALVKAYDGKEIDLEDGRKFHSTNMIWAAGIKGESIPGLDNIKYVRGNRIKVNRHNLIKNYQNIYSIGDIAYMETEKYPEGHPQVAQVAIQQANTLASNLNKIEDNLQLKDFEYTDKGSMATIGRHLAVADLPGMKVSGPLAWMAWLFVHLMAIVGVKNRFLIFINWLWSYFTFDQSLRLLIRPKMPEEN